MCAGLLDLSRNFRPSGCRLAGPAPELPFRLIDLDPQPGFLGHQLLQPFLERPNAAPAAAVLAHQQWLHLASGQLDLSDHVVFAVNQLTTVHGLG